MAANNEEALSASDYLVPCEVIPNIVLLTENETQHWRNIHEFFLVKPSDCKHIYSFLRAQPQEQGWMTLAFHVLFLNFCIDNHGLFKMAGRIAQVNTAVVDMLRKIPTDPQDYINALKSVYEDYIKNESDLRNPDLSGGFIKSVTSWKYYCGLKHLYHLVFSGVERVAQYHPVIDFFKNLCVQVKAAKTQNDEQNLAAWFKIVKQAETPNVDVDLSALISSMQMSDSGAEKSALDGLMAAMGNMQVSTTYGEGGKARLITPEQMRMSGMGGVGAAFGPAVLRDQGGMGGAGAGYGSGPPGTQNM